MTLATSWFDYGSALSAHGNSLQLVVVEAQPLRRLHHLLNPSALRGACEQAQHRRVRIGLLFLLDFIAVQLV